MTRTTWMAVLTCGLLAGCQPPSDTVEEVEIGVLLPLTGDLAAHGESSRVAVELAEEEINLFYESIGSNRRITLLIENTATSPSVAQERLGDISQEGAKVVIGPMTSDALSRCRAFAERVSLVLISPSSTAPSLALEDDGVFRFVPDDRGQAAALAEVMRQDGIQALAFLVRDGMWGEELSALVASEFAERGGVIVGTVGYDPLGDNRNDFRDELEDLEAIVSAAVDDFGADRVAVQLISYGEGERVFEQAAANAVLSSPRWYGSAGLVLSDGLSEASPAAQFAATVGYTAPVFGPVDAERLADVSAVIAERLGRTPDVYALIAYDALWGAALTINEAEEADDVAFLTNALPEVVSFYNGASGRVMLNDAGDRTDAAVDFWTLTQASMEFEWRRTARYEDGTLTPIDE